jgi:hypothetical protein
MAFFKNKYFFLHSIQYFLMKFRFLSGKTTFILIESKFDIELCIEKQN